jgi:hypothetical protein
MYVDTVLCGEGPVNFYSSMLVYMYIGIYVSVPRGDFGATRLGLRWAPLRSQWRHVCVSICVLVSMSVRRWPGVRVCWGGRRQRSCTLGCQHP